MGTGLSHAHFMLCYWLSLKCSLTDSLPPFLSFSVAHTLALPFFLTLLPLLYVLVYLSLSHWRREIQASVFSGWERECHVAHIHGMSLVSLS